MKPSDVGWYDLHTPVPPDRSLETFCLTALLNARISVGFETRDDDFHANLYLAFLLADSLLGRRARLGSTVRHDLEVAAERTPANYRHNFELYQGEADTLLVHIGIFDGPERLQGRGALYYAHAASYCQQMKHARVPLVTVLEQLAGSFGSFVQVLRRIGMDAFPGFTLRTRQDLRTFERFLDREQAQRTLTEARNRFLDLWKPWHDSGATEVPAELRASADALHALNPAFPDAVTLFPDQPGPA